MTRDQSRAARNARALSTDHLSSGLGERTSVSGASAMFTQFITLLIQVGNAAVLARLLSPSEFGLVAMAMVVTGFIALFTDLGLSSATIQRAEIDQNLVSALHYISIALGVVLLVVACALSPVAGRAFGDGRVSDIILVLSVVIPLSAATAQHRALLRRSMRWKALLATQLSSQVVGSVVGIILAAAAGAGHWSIVGATIATAVTGLLAARFASGWRPSAVTDWHQTRSAISFGAHLTAFSFLQWFVRNSDNALIGRSHGATELGHYTRAYQLLTLPLTLIATPASSAVIPALSRLQREPERWARRLLESFSAVYLGASFVAAALIATAEAVVRVIYGPGWEQAGTIFVILLVSIFASTVMNGMGWIYISLGRTRRMAIWGLISCPIFIGAFFAGISFGAIGVATAFSAAVLLLAVPCVFYGTHDTPLRAGSVFRTAAGPTALGLLAALAGRLLARPADTPTLIDAIEAIAVGGTVATGIYALGAMILMAFDPMHKEFGQRVGRIAAARLRLLRFP